MKNRLQSKYCVQLLTKKERGLGLENKYFSTQTHTEPEGILMFCAFILSMPKEFMIRIFLCDFGGINNTKKGAGHMK